MASRIGCPKDCPDRIRKIIANPDGTTTIIDCHATCKIYAQQCAYNEQMRAFRQQQAKEAEYIASEIKRLARYRRR